jgi:hypothetical protein
MRIHQISLGVALHLLKNTHMRELEMEIVMKEEVGVLVRDRVVVRRRGVRWPRIS